MSIFKNPELFVTTMQQDNLIYKQNLSTMCFVHDETGRTSITLLERGYYLVT